MNSLSIYLLVCRKYLVEHKKKLLISMGGFLGICVIFGFIIGINSYTSSGNFAVYLFFAGVECSLVASRMFAETVMKEGKTSLLMIPASAAQKFFPRLVMVTLAPWILIIVGYFVYGYVSIFSYHMGFDVWVPLFNPFDGWNQRMTMALMLLVSFFLLSQSLFIFGAVAWPKRSFLKTIVLMAVLLMAFIFFAWLFARITHRYGVSVVVTDETAFTWSVVTILILISIGITAAAYYKFKRITL